MDSIFAKIKDYGEQTVCYTLGAFQKNATTLTVYLANELQNLDEGRELSRYSKNVIPSSFFLRGEKLDFNVIYTSPKCKKIAEKLSRVHQAELRMLF